VRLAAGLLLWLSASVALAASAPAIIPRPATLEPRDGEFRLRADSVIVTERAAAAEAQWLASALGPALGAAPKVVVARQVGGVRRRLHLCGKRPRPSARCRTWIRLDQIRRKAGPAESYSLDVAPGFALVRAGDTAGLFYGAESLRQLLPSRRRPSGRHRACASSISRASRGAERCSTPGGTSCRKPSS
jgi:hexosaminidase